MKISVGLLAYNSERWIAESAGCLQSLVDEVFVLVDRATNDATTRILDTMKIPWEYRTWNHSYGDAKNTLIDHLTGDWLIILDDDEKLSFEGASKLIQKIKEVDSDQNIHGIQIARKHHFPYWVTDETSYIEGFFPDAHTQAFRKGYRYTGHVHEGIAIPMERVVEWSTLDNIFIHHHAFKGDREKWEAPKHNYYQALSRGDKFPEGEHPF